MDPRVRDTHLNKRYLQKNCKISPLSYCTLDVKPLICSANTLAITIMYSSQISFISSPTLLKIPPSYLHLHVKLLAKSSILQTEIVLFFFFFFGQLNVGNSHNQCILYILCQFSNRFESAVLLFLGCDNWISPKKKTKKTKKKKNKKPFGA